MFAADIGGARLVIAYEGRERERDSSWRRRYRYSITTAEWQYVGNDLRSGVGAPMDEAGMMRTLCSFLAACAESRAYPGGPGENAGLFPPHVGQWALENDDEISLASMEPEPKGAA